MKVAIIGAGGFVGQKVAKLLSEDPEISSMALVDRGDIPLSGLSQTDTFVGDFGDPDLRAKALDGADAVVHLAAILGGAAEADYDLARQVNIDATLDMFEHLRDQNPATRMVFASTIAVFAKPLPDLVADSTPTGPSMVYGAQKLMMEIALSNFTTKGWLDGISLRPSGVMARDGADAGLKTAFMSRLFWCVKRGEDIILPVTEDSKTWLTSIDNVARNFIHAAKHTALGPERALTLPALSVTFGELVQALQHRFPDSPSKVTFAPDAEIVQLFGSYPKLETPAADRLGFSRDANAVALVDSALT